MNRTRTVTVLVAAGFVALTVIPLLGNAYLFDWDEVNFAECAREMIVSGDYLHPQIEFEPFWEKPPLFFWLQAASMHVFGVSEFAARFPNALVGIATVVLLILLGARWLDLQFGSLWALLWVGSLLPQFYMHSGLIDPLFNLLMFSSCTAALTSLHAAHRYRWLTLSGLLLGLAVLTKGPVAFGLVGIPLLVVWMMRYGWKRTMLDGVIVFLFGVLPFALWLLSDRSEYGQWFMHSFLRYQIRLLTTGDAGHSGPLYYHVVVLLLGCFPASWLALPAVKPTWRSGVLQLPSIAMVVMLVTVLVVFSIVQTKIVHYSSLAYFPITFFAAQVLYRWWHKPNRRFPIALVMIGSVLVAAAMIATPLVLANRDLLLQLVRDDFARSIVETTVPHWKGIEWSAGALVLVAVAVALLMVRRVPRAALGVMMIGLALSVSAFVRIVAPRIQDFTQRPVVEFCRRYAQSDVIIHPVGFKTYMHLYYAKRRPDRCPRSLGVPRSEWEAYLLDGNPPCDVIFVAKRTKAADLLRRSDFVQLDDPQSAWLFLLRPHNR
jgi:4-amino-4-deoxy-L-arabinose transferase-like glycosyltransferase